MELLNTFDSMIKEFLEFKQYKRISFIIRILVFICMLPFFLFSTMLAICEFLAIFTYNVQLKMIGIIKNVIHNEKESVFPCTEFIIYFFSFPVLLFLNLMLCANLYSVYFLNLLLTFCLYISSLAGIKFLFFFNENNLNYTKQLNSENMATSPLLIFVLICLILFSLCVFVYEKAIIFSLLYIVLSVVFVLLIIQDENVDNLFENSQTDNNVKEVKVESEENNIGTQSNIINKENDTQKDVKNDFSNETSIADFNEQSNLNINLNEEDIEDYEIDKMVFEEDDNVKNCQYKEKESVTDIDYSNNEVLTINEEKDINSNNIEVETIENIDFIEEEITCEVNNEVQILETKQQNIIAEIKTNNNIETKIENLDNKKQEIDNNIDMSFYMTKRNFNNDNKIYEEENQNLDYEIDNEDEIFKSFDLDKEFFK